MKQNNKLADQLSFTVIVNVGGHTLDTSRSYHKPFAAFSEINVAKMNFIPVSDKKLDGIIRRKDETYKAMRGSNTKFGEPLTKIAKESNTYQSPLTQFIITKFGDKYSPNSFKEIMRDKKTPNEKELIAIHVLELVNDRVSKPESKISFTYNSNGKQFTYSIN